MLYNFSKKGQISAQIFIYVVAIILFSLVLLYGYNAIKGFKEKSEQVAYIKFKTNLISTVKMISTDVGSVKKEEFFIGGEYSKVCFIRNYRPDKVSVLNSIQNANDMVVYDSVESGTDKNVFLFTNRLQESFNVGEINVSDGGYKCIKVINGKAKIKFEGKGDHAYISDGISDGG